MASESTMDLNGKRIVVVEDDYLLATELCRELRDLGATVLGPAPTPFYALQLINRKRIDAAVLDVRLHGTMVFEVADRLVGQGVPILFATGLSREELPGRFRSAELLEKPLDSWRIAARVNEMTHRPVPPRPVMQPLPQAAAQVSPIQVFALALAARLGSH